MKSRDFCYWLQGFFELDDKSDVKKSSYSLTHQQIEAIRNHLAMVFRHEIDPSFGDKKEQEILSTTHEGISLRYAPSEPPKFNC